MRINLRLFGELKQYLPREASGPQTTVEVPDGLDALGLILRLGIPYDSHEGAIVVAVNDVQVDHNHPIQDGDTISMFAPLAGGAGRGLNGSMDEGKSGEVKASATKEREDA